MPRGGASFLGHAGRSATTNAGSGGVVGVPYGGGGGGGYNYPSQGTDRNGAVGADGIVIVHLYA